MAVKTNQKVSIKRLKKQVRVLQKKEERSRHQLRAALKKIHKLAHSYKIKLANKLNEMKAKIAETEFASYAQAASDLQQQMLKSVNKKSKALKSVIGRFEKRLIKSKKTIKPKKKKTITKKAASGKLKHTKKRSRNE